MKDVIKNTIKFLIFILLCIAIVYVVKWAFETIYYSDMPVWIEVRKEAEQALARMENG